MKLLILFCVVLIGTIVIDAGTVTFNNFTTTSTLKENDDPQQTLISLFTATCNYACDTDNDGVPDESCPDSASEDCSCFIPPTSSLFQLEGNPSGYTLYKKQCSDDTCGSYSGAPVCVTTDGCANAGMESITVTCNGTNTRDSASDTAVHTITFEPESADKVLDITNLDSTVNPSRTDGVNAVIFTTTPTAGLQIYTYEELTSVVNSWIVGTVRLFGLDTRIKEYSDWSIKSAALERRCIILRNPYLITQLRVHVGIA